jgi:radical SAM-linked protein
VRYAIKFSKESEIKFISHLDLMRTLQRIIKRSGLPIEYSKGFNPHMNLSIAQPLSVGIYSEGEYMDIGLEEEIDENIIVEKLLSSCPMGIKILDAKKVPHMENTAKIPQSMALIDAAAYDIKIKYLDITELNKLILELQNRNEWTTMKKSKSGEKLVDIKSLVKDIRYEIEGDNLFVYSVLSCGSKENLSAELLANYIKDNTSNVNKEAFVDIKRKELYTDSQKGLISLMEYYRDNF